MTKWISVKEGLPEEPKENDPYRKSYLVYLNKSFGCKYATWVYLGDGEWWWEELDETLTDAVTHWMPLPEPPKSEK